MRSLDLRQSRGVQPVQLQRKHVNVTGVGAGCSTSQQSLTCRCRKLGRSHSIIFIALPEAVHLSNDLLRPYRLLRGIHRSEDVPELSVNYAQKHSVIVPRLPGGARSYDTGWAFDVRKDTVYSLSDLLEDTNHAQLLIASSDFNSLQLW